MKTRLIIQTVIIIIAGNYEVEFKGTALPSGVYFYRLQAGNFVETKKMIFMK